MEITRMCELFSKQALIVGEGHWGLFEVVSVQSRDSGEVTSVDIFRTETWVGHTYDFDDVLAFVSPSEAEWVESSLSEAYAIYEESDRSERDWDTFRVTARLLV